MNSIWTKLSFRSSSWSELAHHKETFSLSLTYGFDDIDENKKNDWNEYLPVYQTILERREKRWDGQQLNSADALERSKMMKRFCRKGIPAKLRPIVWSYLCNVDHKMRQNSDVYYKSKDAPLPVDIQQVLDVDLPRTFPENKYFHKDCPEEQSLLKPLENVLTAIATVHADIRYCQGMNYVAATILLALHDHDPEYEVKTFWIMDHLVQTILRRYYHEGMTGLLVDCRVLLQLLHNKNRKVYQAVMNTKIDMSCLVTKWLICLFADVLPIETALRVFDCLLYEGDKILFRASIALIRLHQKQLLNASDMPELIKYFRTMVDDRQTLQCHSFCGAMFDIGRLQRKEIERLRTMYEDELNMEREKRAKSKATKNDTA